MIRKRHIILAMTLPMLCVLALGMYQSITNPGTSDIAINAVMLLASIVLLYITYEASALSG